MWDRSIVQVLRPSVPGKPAMLGNERHGSPVVRTLAYHAARPGSIPGLGGENY